jgi:hypothetical protein
MAFRFRRRRERAGGALEGDAAAVSEALDHATAVYGSDPRDFDLSVAIGDLLDRAPTADARALVRAGLDDEQFYESELRPNWEGLSKGERAAKVRSFARFANALGDGGDDAGGMAPIVRTKLLVLAWAYDRTYDEGFLPRIATEPEGFGRLELSPSH